MHHTSTQISLARRIPGIEYTFVLAGFLKILTIGSLAYSAPVETLRTAAGEDVWSVFLAACSCVLMLY